MPLPKDPEKAKLWRQRQSKAQRGKSRNKGKNNPFYGKQHSKETRRKISEAVSGDKHPNFGKQMPQHVKDAFSKANKGRPAPFRGRHHTDEAKAKLSAAMKGNQNAKGRILTADARRAISEKNKGKHVGAKSGKWKGGITPINVRERGSLAYREWRLKVFRRDIFTCQFCRDNRGRNLVAHHVIFFSVNTSLRHKVCNGMTLCIDCHNKYHKNWRTRRDLSNILLQTPILSSLAYHSPSSCLNNLW